MNGYGSNFVSFRRWANTFCGLLAIVSGIRIVRSRLKILGFCLLLIGLLNVSPTVSAAPGDLDTTFSQDGKLFDYFISGGDDIVYGTAIQTDGKIVAVGKALFGGVISCGLSRYNTDGTLDRTFDDDGRLVIPSGSTFICHAVAIQADGKIVAAGHIGNVVSDDFAVVRLNTNGVIDTSFDSDGIAITYVGNTDDEARDVAIQSDGKIVVAGFTYSPAFANDFALVRYNPDGSLDTAFGSDGKVITPVGPSSAHDNASAIALQTDGKIVAAGSTSFGTAGTSDFALVRYNPDGSLDTAFDSDGKITTPVGNSSDLASAVAIQADGKIVAAGVSEFQDLMFPQNSHRDFSVVRYNTNGSLDTSFDLDGKVITTIPITSEGASAAVIQTDGKIVVAGSIFINRLFYDFALARYNTDGSLDTSFDSDGIIFTPVSTGDDIANAVAVQTDGRIVAAGYSSGNSLNDFALVRYNTNGSLDPAFGSSGKTSHDVGFWGSSSAGGVATQPDGKIVVAGFSRNIGVNTGNTDFALSRYNADGSPDTSFDSDGKVVTPVFNGNDEARAVAVQADGKIVAAGVYFDSTTPHFALVRYNTDGSLDTSFDLDGKVTTSVGNFDQLYAMAIQADGKIVVAGASDGGSNFDFALVRYNPDGSLDTSFDSDGKVITPVMNFDLAYAVAIQPDGKIVAAGRTYNGTNIDFAAVRYNINGSLDTSFDSDGKVVTSVLNSDDMAKAVAIQADGKIVAAGLSNNSKNNDFALVRYNANGSLDTSFDSDGKLTTPVFNRDDQANAVAIQANGKIIAAGYANSDNLNDDFALVRYNTDGSLDSTFNADGKATLDFWSSGNDILYGMTLDSTGRIVVVGEASQNFAVARFTGDLVPNVKTLFDFDGDGRSDVSVFRPSNGFWYLLRSTAGFSSVQWGLSTDVLTPADYDGDLKTDVAFWRAAPNDQSRFFIIDSLTGTQRDVRFASPGDIPLPSDWDGDGKADLAVYRNAPTTGGQSYFFYRPSSQPSVNFITVPWGTQGDKPVIGDFDGDGKTDAAVFRSSNGGWYILQSSNNQFYGVGFGTAEDKPTPADFDGDGKTDVAVFRPSTGSWYRLNSATNQFVGVQFGQTGDVPAAADYDGDGKADISVFRPTNGTWYQQHSASGFSAQQFGTNGDVPIPSVFGQ